MQRQVIYSIQLHPSLPGLSKYNHTEESNNSTVLTSKGLNLWLLLSRFSRVRLCATPWTAAYQASPSVGFSRQEHWSGLPFPSPMHESQKWKGSRSVVSDSYRPHGLQPTRLLCPWISQARVLEWAAIAIRVPVLGNYEVIPRRGDNGSDDGTLIRGH